MCFLPTHQLRMTCEKLKMQSGRGETSRDKVRHRKKKSGQETERRERRRRDQERKRRRREKGRRLAWFVNRDYLRGPLVQIYCDVAAIFLCMCSLTVSPWQPKWQCQGLKSAQRVTLPLTSAHSCIHLSFSLSVSVSIHPFLEPDASLSSTATHTATPAPTRATRQEKELAPIHASSKTSQVALPLPPAHRQTRLVCRNEIQKDIQLVRSCYWDLKQEEHVPPLSVSKWGVMVSGTSDWSMSFSLAMMCFTKQFAASSMLMFS